MSQFVGTLFMLAGAQFVGYSFDRPGLAFGLSAIIIGWGMYNDKS